MIYDSMRGVVFDGKDTSLIANGTEVEKGGTYNLDDKFIEFQPTGFKLTAGWSSVSTTNVDYIYVAIRRPDPYVGKPIEAASDVFAMDAGNNSAVENWTSGFLLISHSTNKQIALVIGL